MRIGLLFGLLSILVACNSGDAPAEPEAAAVEAAAVEQVPAADADADAGATHADAAEGHHGNAADGEHAAGGEGHHGDAATCSCSKGKAGETVWCATCSKGYIEGQATMEKTEVDAAIASAAGE
jgi:hypothetical protein